MKKRRAYADAQRMRQIDPATIEAQREERAAPTAEASASSAPPSPPPQKPPRRRRAPKRPKPKPPRKPRRRNKTRTKPRTKAPSGRTWKRQNLSPVYFNTARISSPSVPPFGPVRSTPSSNFMRTTESSWTSTPHRRLVSAFALTTASPLAHRTIASLARANVVVNQRIGTHSTLLRPYRPGRCPRWASQHHSHRAIVKTSLAVVRARVSIDTARDAMTTTSRVEDASTASASASLLRGGDARASRHHRGPAVDLVVARARVARSVPSPWDSGRR